MLDTLFLLCYSSPVDRRYEHILLFDFYGELLTPRQKQIYEDVVMNDCSESEVAREYGISRQGVHDMIRRIDHTLESYEERLNLLKRYLGVKDRILSLHDRTADPAVRSELEVILEEL